MDMTQIRRRWTYEEVAKLLSMAQKCRQPKSLPRLAGQKVPSARRPTT
jgi:hypothetical protein